MDIFLIYVLKGLLLPPAVNLLGLIAAWVCRGWRVLATLLVALSLGSLFVLSMPRVSMLLASTLETIPPFDLTAGRTRGIQAIVVPGCGRYLDAPEFHRDAVSLRGLERLRYAARIHHATGWPVAVVGGIALGQGTPEGPLMAESLQTDFGVTARWVESSSRNTAENARNARALLPVDTILLVTQALDMPRAADAFAAAGFRVVPAPIAFVHREPLPPLKVFDFLPEPDALSNSRIALHEWLGVLWYRLRY